VTLPRSKPPIAFYRFGDASVCLIFIAVPLNPTRIDGFADDTGADFREAPPLWNGLVDELRDRNWPAGELADPRTSGGGCPACCGAPFRGPQAYKFQDSHMVMCVKAVVGLVTDPNSWRLRTRRPGWRAGQLTEAVDERREGQSRQFPLRLRPENTRCPLSRLIGVSP